MKFITRYKKLTFWNKLGAVGAACSILALIIWFIWPKGPGDITIGPEAVVQVPVNSLGAVMQNMSDSPGGMQVAGSYIAGDYVVKGGAKRNIYKEIDGQLKDQILSNLTNVRKEYSDFSYKIEISADKGSLSRLKIADEIGNLLNEAGFDTRVRQSMLITSDRKPIHVAFRPEYRDFGEAILMAFEPALRANVGVRESEDRQSGDISIAIVGKPMFTERGAIFFEDIK